jgi:hypothetical protein
MHLKITISYFDGRGEDVLNHTGLSLEAARTRRDDMLQTFQKCITEGQIFYGGDDQNMMAIGPQLLARSHFKFEITEE